MNNQSISGFFLPGWSHLFPKYLKEMIEDVVSGKLRIVHDLRQTTSEGQFNGIDAVVRGVELSIMFQILLIILFTTLIASSQRSEYGKGGHQDTGPVNYQQYVFVNANFVINRHVFNLLIPNCWNKIEFYQI